MKNKQMLEEGKEALQRTLLMMNYDMKKTLTENVEVISEQSMGGGFTPQYQAAELSKINKNTPAQPSGLSQVQKNDIATKKFPCVKYEPKDGDTVGHYAPAKMDFVRLFYKDSIVIVWENKTIKQYVRNGNASGAETAKGTWKCKADNSNVDVIWDDDKPVPPTQKQKTPSITDKNVLNTLKFDFQYPGDKAYSYAFVPGTVAEATSTQTGTWYAKNNKTGKVFDISKNYPQTAQKLSTQFPNGDKAGTQTPETPAAETPAEPDAQTTPAETTPPETAATDIKDIKGKGLEVKPVSSLKQPQNINLQTNPKKTDMSNFDTFGPSNPEVKESLKKSLKKNLLEVKEKKQDLLIESNIIRKRFEMISEGRDLNIDTDSDYIVESLFAEISYLKRQGYNRTLINEEGVFGWLGSLLGGTATEVPDVIKEYVSSWLLKKMGVSADSYFGNVIVTLIGDLSFSDYDTFFSDCRFASNKVSDALINGYLRQLQEENDSTSGAGGFVISAIRNAIVTYFADSKDSLIQKLEDQIINFLCPILSKLTGVMGDKASDIKQKVMS
jgi:hypothetical protein